MTDEQLIRAAILDVIDDGDHRGDKWFIYSDDEDEANSERLGFADAVIIRVRQLKRIEESDALTNRMRVECELREEVAALEDERVDAAEANHPR